MKILMIYKNGLQKVAEKLHVKQFYCITVFRLFFFWLFIPSVSAISDMGSMHYPKYYIWSVPLRNIYFSGLCFSSPPKTIRKTSEDQQLCTNMGKLALYTTYQYRSTGP